LDKERLCPSPSPRLVHTVVILILGLTIERTIGEQKQGSFCRFMCIDLCAREKCGLCVCHFAMRIVDLLTLLTYLSERSQRAINTRERDIVISTRPAPAFTCSQSRPIKMLFVLTHNVYKRWLSAENSLYRARWQDGISRQYNYYVTMVQSTIHR